MTAVMNRDFKAYFKSPIGYIFLAVFYVFAGFFFFFTSLLADSSDISYVFSNMFMIVLFLIPILTMRIFSEDLKNKTDQALLTAPVSLLGIVLGKFLACCLVFLIGLSVTILYGLIVSAFAMPNWLLIWGNFVAMLLLGMAIIAIGMFISSLTVNQVIAAVGTFAISFALILIDSLASLFTNTYIIAFLNSISFTARYDDFTTGIFDFSNVVFFLSICALFIFLTVRVLEKRRWA